MTRLEKFWIMVDELGLGIRVVIGELRWRLDLTHRWARSALSRLPWRLRSLRRRAARPLRAMWERLIHPGRYSVDWDRPELIARMRPTLGGIYLKDCITLDEREGWAEVYLMDDHGELMTAETTRGRVIVRTRRHGIAKMTWLQPEGRAELPRP